MALDKEELETMTDQPTTDGHDGSVETFSGKKRNLLNLDRPRTTIQQTDMRVHREVTLFFYINSEVKTLCIILQGVHKILLIQR